MKPPLIQFRRNITSQFGEDGILEEIFNRIGVGQSYCVEFGAWDGKHLSNTFNLWSNKGWHATLIEGDPSKFIELQNRVNSRPGIKTINRFVISNGPNSLDSILKESGCPIEFDLLSIDIDSFDYHVWDELKIFNPRVVVIEFNPTIPPHLEIISPPRPNRLGSSALALVNLSHTKNYQLATCTDVNCFFIRSDLFTGLEIPECKLKDIFIPSHITYVFTTYSGLPIFSNTPVYYPIKKGFIGTIKGLIKKLIRHPSVILPYNLSGDDASKLRDLNGNPLSIKPGNYK